MPPGRSDVGELPCGLSTCILNDEVLPLPIEILQRDLIGDDVTPQRCEELRSALTDAESFYRQHCRQCDLAGSPEQRNAKLGLFTLSDRALAPEDDRRPVGLYRKARRARKRLEADLGSDRIALASDLSRALRAAEALEEALGTTQEPPVQALLERERRRMRMTLSRVLAEEANVASLMDALPHLRRDPDREVDPGAELAFLETWERRVRIVGDDLVEDTELTWVHEEQSALPASRAEDPEEVWNRSRRIVGETDAGPRLVVEAILETDLARGDGDLASLVIELVDHRRQGAAAHGYHHVVGFVRNGSWPEEIRDLSRRLTPSSGLPPGETSLIMLDLDAGSLPSKTEHIPLGLKFIYHPTSNERLLEEVRQVTEDELRAEGFIEIDALEDEVGLPRPAIRWFLDRLPLSGRMTTVEDVGEVYQRGLLEG